MSVSKKIRSESGSPRRNIGLVSQLFWGGLSIAALVMLSRAVSYLQDVGISFHQISATVLGVMASVLAVAVWYSEARARRESEQKIAVIEERALEHPEKPQLAWDLARAKLESYLDRNLSQVRSIYWLTLFVMGCGFGFVLFGLLKAFDSPEKLAVSIVASASGVIISFIGGSFLFIYRSILTQSKDYVSVLERINAVGMAVQVIANIPEESATLKHNTTAELAKQLLRLYAKEPSSTKRVSRKPSAPDSE